jgi:photosystem II stability/assembly factor-like uncharacterized protein
MTEARRIRAAAVIGIVGLVMVATAAGYLRVGPFRQLPVQPRSTALPVPAFSTVQFKDLQTVSAGSAWVFTTALDGAGLVYASTDGGRAWSQLMIPQSVAAQKYGIQLIDARHGLLQLQRGLMSTADAGRSWHQVPLPPGQAFGLGAHFITADRGYYQDLAAYPNQAAQPSSMWWTANGGASWNLIWQVNADHPADGAVPLDGTKFVLAFDGSRGWLDVRSGGSERLLETVDGGRNWLSTPLPVSGSVILYDLQFLDDGSAILIGKTGAKWLAIRSRDGGRTWVDSRPIPIATPPEFGGYDRPTLLDIDHWLVADGSVIHSTADGGAAWRDIRSKLPAGIASLHDLWLYQGGRGWATGADAVAGYHVLTTLDNGATWTLSPVPHLGLPS